MKNEYMIINSKFKSYCYDCHFTIWKNEKIKYSGKPRHLNCIKCLEDQTPRTLNNSYKKNVGDFTKKQMISILKGKKGRRKITNVKDWNR